MKISARNVLSGKVLSVTPGAVDTEVVVEIAPGKSVAAIITQQSVAHMGLKAGDDAYVVIKAHSVMIGKD
ncbi:MAG: TOBE domain-containing protein [Rhodocyclaceae bacterium]|nr:TOBE domain-containing protein [Rhodocyclaceae bacterium]